MIGDETPHAPRDKRTDPDGDVRLDLSGILSESIGSAHGITESEWKGIERELEQVAGEIDEYRQQGRLAVLDLPNRTEGIAELHEIASACRTAPNFVILGIGGSALGARAIYDACLPPFYNLLPGSARRGPRLFVAENVDPESLDALLRVAPPSETIYNVISKSGSTVETIAQLMVVWERLRRELGERAPERIVVTTDPQRGFLRKLAHEKGIRALPVPSAVGGRFSVLTAVGLFPAAVAGIEPEDLLRGAARMDERCRSRSWRENPALALAAAHYLADRRKGAGIAVMMPYSDALRSFSEWFCQIWAESLGKRATPSGTLMAPVGQTPVRAVGATDQHSQLQLYVEGPNDKLFTILSVESPRVEVPIPNEPLPGLQEAGLAHIGGHGIGELLALERCATELVLTGQERPLLSIEIPRLSADALGQLFYLYEWATIAAGMLYHVNPFDQPGVEEGKRLTHAAMGQSGVEDLGERVRAYRDRTDRYRI